MTKNKLPYNYVHCFAAAGQCAQCEICLRSIAARREMEELEPLKCVNPRYVEKVAAGQACEYFREKKYVSMAYGFVKMLNEMPAKKATLFRQSVQHLYGSRITYFRSRRGERPIPPEEQKQIVNILRSVGIEEEPSFDRYEDHLVW